MGYEDPESLSFPDIIVTARPLPIPTPTCFALYHPIQACRFPDVLTTPVLDYGESNGERHSSLVHRNRHPTAIDPDLPLCWPPTHGLYPSLSSNLTVRQPGSPHR
ncbi:uncharacterized protein ARMOST_13631 [Armillaria ostoyae]|uniref:Uncharacterized protein n=1 Tax=Armillaria ostoyae TaxID=47428 RepID=A0A284RNA8_ARMOS|nr:uncharacterized protein ARMOST_13631 [Armillaria ostoyae]